MASNVNSNRWRVRINSLPASITSGELAQSLNVHTSRIKIPRNQKGGTYFAWINSFQSEQKANEFVNQNSNLTISNQRIECKVYKPREDDGNNRRRQGARHRLPTEKNGNANERKLCRHANRGTCKFGDDQCNYRHTKCSNYESCLDRKCLLAHASSSSVVSPCDSRSSSSNRSRSSSNSSKVSVQSVNPSTKPCPDSIRCHDADCLFRHPEGWVACRAGVACTNYECASNHPRTRRAKCHYENRCNNKHCPFLHPNTRNASRDRNHYSPLPTKKQTTKVIELSNAGHHFLSTFGKRVLDKIREEQGTNEEVNFKDGKLQLSGENTSIKKIELDLKQLLREQNVKIADSLAKHLQLPAGGNLWKRFLQKYRVGFSCVPISITARHRGENDGASQYGSDPDANQSDDGEDDDDDDRKSVISSASGNTRRGQRFVQVTLCSDSEDSLSKATTELQSYSLANTSWVLTQDEVAFILKETQKNKPMKGDITVRKQCTHIKFYLVDIVRAGQKGFTSIFVFKNRGVWHVKVRGFKQDVNIAVDKIKDHLNNVVKIEVQIPISGAMAMFLRTKALSDIKQIEKKNSIKIFVSSPKREKNANDHEDDEKHCLKLSGSNSRIDAAKENVENFLERLSEQDQDFTCESWDISRNINSVMLTHLKKIQDSHDCEAVGLIKFYRSIERRETTPKVTISIVGMNETVADDVLEQCRDIVEGYVVWKPSADEYRAISTTLFGRRSPSIEEFRQQWDTAIQLDQQTNTITIPARSKVIADDIKEALLNLGEENRNRVVRVSEFIPIRPNIRRFVNPAIAPLVNEAKSQKVFIEFKNRAGCTVRGRPDLVTDLKQRMNAIINEIEQKLITRRLKLSSAESDLLRLNRYELLNRIERETETVIRDIKVDTRSFTATASDDDSAVMITVMNSRDQTIIVEKGDIIKARNVDAIVNAANGTLNHAGGVDKVIADAAGPLLDQECRQLIAKNGGLPFSAGKAVKTTAGNLPFKCIVHAIGPQYVDGNHQERPLLYSCVLSSLRLVEKEGYTSVALPAISASTYGFPLGDCTDTVVRAIKQFFADQPQSILKKVILLDKDDAVCNSLAREVTIDHSTTVLDDGGDIMNYELPPLTAKWYWMNDTGETINTDHDIREIENAFQKYLKTASAPELQIGADNLKSGVIVNYTIHFRPDLKQLLASNPKVLDGRLVCGCQKRVSTGYKRDIIRYPVEPQQQQQNQSKPIDYRPKPLDLYQIHIVMTEEYWNIIGTNNRAVQQAECAVRKAIDSATISEPFSINLDKNLNTHKQEILKIAAQLQIRIDFQQECPGKLAMVLNGLKANVSEAKLKLALYAQDILKIQVDNDDDLSTPKEWGDQNEECKLVEVVRNDPTFIRINNRMIETIPSIKVSKIERVQNLRIWSHYAMRRRQLKRELQSKPDLQIEMELFHGTRTTPPNEIYNGEYGFDMTFSTSGMWGIGTYFAKNASYSCGSYAHSSATGTRQVFFAQVLTGDVHHCNSDPSLRRPPKKDEAKGGLRYNSVSGQTGGSQVYIVYENRVAYPTYLITFTV